MSVCEDLGVGLPSRRCDKIGLDWGDFLCGVLGRFFFGRIREVNGSSWVSQPHRPSREVVKEGCTA